MRKISPKKIIMQMEILFLREILRALKFRLYLEVHSLRVNLVSCFQNLTLPNVTELLLFYGVYDFETVEKTDFPSIKLMLDAVFTEESDAEYHKYSPINYVTKNFPRCLIASGEVDKLHILQTLEFVKTLDKENVPYQTIYFDKSQIFGLHGFMAFDDFVTNKETREAIGNFLSKNIELSK